MSEPNGRGAAWGPVTVLGAHILDVLAGLLGTADWFLPNGDQLLALTGRHDLGPAIEDVLALGLAGVAVTLGADGCLVGWRDGGAPVALPAIEVDVVDTTGCGDGFTAGMLGGLLLGAEPVDAGSGCTWGPAGSRSAWTPTCRAGARRSRTAPGCALAEVPNRDGCGHRQCRRVRAAMLFPANAAACTPVAKVPSTTGG